VIEQRHLENVGRLRQAQRESGSSGLVSDRRPGGLLDLLLLLFELLALLVLCFDFSLTVLTNFINARESTAKSGRCSVRYF
jgi:hypothetical protein